MVIAVDDPDGQHNITVHRVLPNKPASGPIHPATVSSMNTSKPTYRYVPRHTTAQQSARGNTESSVSNPSADTLSGYGTKQAKQPIFPSFRVGDTLRIRGSINEWRRRDGRVIRELKAGNAIGGEIGMSEHRSDQYGCLAHETFGNAYSTEIIDPAQEMAHIRLVEHLRHNMYNRPFVIPAPELPKQMVNPSCKSTPTKVGHTSDAGSPLKKRRLGAEPSSEAEMSGTMGMSSTAGYGDRVRYSFRVSALL